MHQATSKKIPGIDAKDLQLEIFKNASPQDGSLNVDLELRAAITQAISNSQKKTQPNLC